MYVVFGQVVDYDHFNWWLVEGFMEWDDAERLKLELENFHSRLFLEWLALYEQFAVELNSASGKKYKKRRALTEEISGKYSPILDAIQARHPDGRWEPNEGLTYGIIEIKLTV